MKKFTKIAFVAAFAVAGAVGLTHGSFMQQDEAPIKVAGGPGCWSCWPQ